MVLRLANALDNLKEIRKNTNVGGRGRTPDLQLSNALMSVWLPLHHLFLLYIIYIIIIYETSEAMKFLRENLNGQIR